MPLPLLEAICMSGRSRTIALLIFAILPLCLVTVVVLYGQPPPTPEVVATASVTPGRGGVEVLARGPVHEAYASLTAEPVATKCFAKKPPAALEEMPPDEKPDGDVVWIGGYWAWDDDRSDYLWVSGIWRTPPPGKRWVAGYWRESGTEWQWVPGFWANVEKEEAPQQPTYLPPPPAAPEPAAPAAPPTP